MASCCWASELPSAEHMPKHYTTKSWSSRKGPRPPSSSPSSGRPGALVTFSHCWHPSTESGGELSCVKSATRSGWHMQIHGFRWLSVLEPWLSHLSVLTTSTPIGSQPVLSCSSEIVGSSTDLQSGEGTWVSTLGDASEQGEGAWFPAWGPPRGRGTPRLLVSTLLLWSSE